MDIEFGLTLQSIDKVDMEKESLTGYFWPSLSWKDELLSWPKYDILDGQVFSFRQAVRVVYNISRLVQ